MTLDELFLNTAKFLSKQQERCVNDDDLCMYAGPNGNACAVGCHLPRELAETLDTLSNGEWSYMGILDWVDGNRSPGDPEHPKRKAAKAAVAVFSGIENHELIVPRLQGVHDEMPGRDLESRRRMIDQIKTIAADYDASPECLQALRELQASLTS